MNMMVTESYMVQDYGNFTRTKYGIFGHLPEAIYFNVIENEIKIYRPTDFEPQELLYSWSLSQSMFLVQNVDVENKTFYY